MERTHQPVSEAWVHKTKQRNVEVYSSFSQELQTQLEKTLTLFLVSSLVGPVFFWDNIYTIDNKARQNSRIPCWLACWLVHPKNHRTLLLRGMTLYSKVLGSPNHQWLISWSLIFNKTLISETRWPFCRASKTHFSLSDVDHDVYCFANIPHLGYQEFTWSHDGGPKIGSSLFPTADDLNQLLTSRVFCWLSSQKVVIHS